MCAKLLTSIARWGYLVVLGLLVGATSSRAQVLSTPCDWKPTPPTTLLDLTSELKRSEKPEWQKGRDGDYFVVSTTERLYLHSRPDASCKSGVYIVKGDVAELVDLYPKSGVSSDGNVWARIIFASKKGARDYIGWVKMEALCRRLPSGESVCAAKPAGHVDVADKTKNSTEMQTTREAEEKKAREEAEKAIREEKGRAFAQSSKTRWKRFQKTDVMSGKDDIFAGANVLVGSAIVQAELRCATGIGVADLLAGGAGDLSLTLTIQDGEFKWSQRDDLAPDPWTVGISRLASGRRRLNDRLEPVEFRIDSYYQNIAFTKFGRVSHGTRKDLFVSYGTKAEPLYTAIFEIDTTNGKALIYVPPYDEVVDSIIQGCEGLQDLEFPWGSNPNPR